jgi:dipeptidyl aminopeptidase/acylaminoacyl peptidase
MRHILIAAALTSLAAGLSAQTPVVPATPAPAVLTPEQALKVRRISDLNFSPDGSRLVCVVSEPPKGETPVTHLWLLDVAHSDFRQFTYSPKSENSPRWSPDGKTLAFLSSRGEKMQIYLIRMDGGEAAALTSGKNAVGEFRWSPDGAQIAFLAKEPQTEAEEKKDKDKDDAKVSDREQDLNRLWVIDVSTKKVRQITKGTWRIDQFEWLSPDRLLAVASNKPKEEIWNQSLYTVSMAEGMFTLFGQPAQPFGGVTVSPNRTTLSFLGPRNAGPSPHDLYLQSTGGGEARNVTAAIDRDVHGVKWQDDTTLYAIVPNGFDSRLVRVPVSGTAQPVELPGLAGSFDVARDGALAYVGGAFNRLNELFLKTANHDPVQISHLQEADWKGVKLADAEVFTYKSFDGMSIQAALMKPASATGRLPLILDVHGGPAGKFSADYQAWAQLLVSRGYQVLMVNPRGSSGYGEEFLKANKADWGGGDFKDLMAGVDAVIARGQTDPDRLGIGGWSYGGYMAEWAITQTNRFKAAVSGAGMFDLAAEFGTEAGPEGDEWYFGTPWEHPERFVHSSPYTYIKNARTPTLILQGENDPIDPVGQSTALYRALKRYNVETELVVYPREPHGPREEKHQLDVLTRMIAWFDRYLKPAK